MSDLDSLQIQITASTKPAVHAIEYLRQELGRLNAALSNYGADSTYIKGLKNLATGFDSISNSIAELDVNKLNSVSKAIGELATKGAKLSNLSYVKTFADMGSASEKASLRTKNSLDDIKRTFGITSKEGIESLTQSLNKFYNSANDPEALSKAEQEIKTLITEYMTLNKELIVSGDQIRKYMSGSNFAIPIDAMKEFGDNYKHMIGVLGIKGQNKDLSQGVGLDVLAEEMNGVFGTNFDSSNALNAMNSIYEALVKDGVAVEDLTKKQQKHEASTVEMTQYLDRLYESINKVRAASQSVDENGFLTGEGVDGIGFDAEDILGVETTSKEVTNALNEVQQEIRETQELANPFEGIVKGIGSLQGINITADQFAGIRVLADSLGKLVGSNGEKAGIILPQIASGLAAMAGIHLPDNATQLAALGQALGSFGSAAATRAQGLPQLVEGLKQLKYVKIPDVSGVYDLAAALSKLGGAKIETAIQNMPRLTVAFTDMITAISKAPAVSAETVQLAQAMAQLATASRTVGQSTQKSTTGINLLRGAVSAALPTFKKAQHHTFSLAAAFGKLYASYFLVFRAFRKLGEAMSIASQLTEVQNVVAATFGDMSYKLDDFADKAIYDFGMAELSARKFASRYQAMGAAMGITDQQVAEANEFLTKTLEGQKREIDGVEDNYADLGDTLADMSINITKLAGDYASFFEADIEDVADDMRSILTGMAKPLYDYGISLREADIKEWALKNGLDANIRSMNNAQKTMLRYQYVMANSAKVMNDYQITMNSWANVLRTIRQQFVKFGSIIGEGLINTFKPLLIKFREFMNTLIDLTQKALNAIGKLLGWQIEIEEVGVAMDEDMSNYADSVGDAADNAKKLNAQLRSIDELNNLTTPKDNDNGGGGSGISGAGGGQSKATGGGWKVLPYESDIESWFDLGNRIRDKIIGALSSINWEEIQEKVRENAKNLVELLKGLLVPDDEGNTIGGKVGEFLAQCINTGFDWLVTTTGDMALWAAAGTNIADFFLKFFETIDFEDMAETINNIVDGLKTLLSTACEKLNTPENRKMIADKLKEFFGSIEPDTWGTIALVLGAVTIARVNKWFISQVVVQSFIQFMIAKLSGQEVAVPLIIKPIIKLGGGIKKLAINFGKLVGQTAIGFSNIMKLKVGESLSTAVSGIGTNIASALTGIFAGLGGMRIGLGIGEIRDQLFGKGDTDYQKYYKSFGQGEMVWDAIVGIKDAITDVEVFRGTLKAAKEDIDDNKLYSTVGNAILDWIEEVFGEGSVFQSLFGEGSMFYDICNSIEDTGFKIMEQIKYAFTGHSGGGGGHSFGEMGVEDGEEFVDGIDKGISENSNKINWGGVIYELKAKWGEFTEWWSQSGIVQWWNNSVAPWFTREKWALLGNQIVVGLMLKWEEFKTWWNNTGLKHWIDETTQKFNNLRDTICGEDGIFASLVREATNTWNTLASIFGQTFNIKTPHLSWEEGGVQVQGLLKKALETLDLPTSLPKLTVEWYADGGFPTPGSLFVAGEAGAELLGTMNGRTTVASNSEITGISDTIRSTSSEEIQLLRQQNQLLQGILQKEFGISNGDIFRSVRTSAMEWKKMTGDPAF